MIHIRKHLGRDVSVPGGLERFDQQRNLIGRNLLIRGAVQDQDRGPHLTSGCQRLVLRKELEPRVAGGHRVHPGGNGLEGRIARRRPERGVVLDPVAELEVEDLSAGVGGAGQQHDAFERRLVLGHHRRNQAAFAVPDQTEPGPVDFGASSKPSQPRLDVLGEIGAGGRGRIAPGAAKPPVVHPKHGNSSPGQ